MDGALTTDDSRLTTSKHVDLSAVLSFVAVGQVGEQVFQVVLRPVPGEKSGLAALIEGDLGQELGGPFVGACYSSSVSAAVWDARCAT